MSLFFADLVREASWGTGTGDLPLEGALPGHRRFADVAPQGVRFHYCIASVTHPDQWETGEGEIGSGNTLVRLPLASSAGGPAVDFMAGLKTIALTVAADWFAARDGGVAAIGDVSGLQEALDAKAAAVHGHAAADISGLQGLLDSKASSDHTHAPSEIAGLEAELEGKASAAHGHVVAEVAGLQAELDGEQPLDAKLTAFAGLAGAADTLFYLTGPAAAGVTALTAFGRSLIDDDDAAAGRSTLGLGTIATQAADDVAITGGTIGGLSSLGLDGAIDATGPIDAGSVVRSTGNAAPSSGVGCEIGWLGATSRIMSFNRSTTSYEPLELTGSQVDLKVSTAVIGSFNGNGLFASGSVNAAEGFRATGADAAGWTGPALELFLSSGRGNVLSYDRTAGSYLPLDLRASEVGFQVSGSVRASLTDAALSLASGVTLQVNGTRVVASRRTGWSAPSGTASRAGFATSTVTTQQLAERVKALIDDLTAHGLIGS